MFELFCFLGCIVFGGIILGWIVPVFLHILGTISEANDLERFMAAERQRRNEALKQEYQTKPIAFKEVIHALKDDQELSKLIEKIELNKSYGRFSKTQEYSSLAK